MALEEHFLPIRICGAWVSLRTLNLYEPNDLRVVRLCAVGGLERGDVDAVTTDEAVANLKCRCRCGASGEDKADD